MTPSIPTLRAGLLLSALALALGGCGGGDDPATPVPPAPVSPTLPAPVVPTLPAPVAAAPLVISAATPATTDGTLDKTLVVGQNESGISNSVGAYSSSGPNDHCRVALYQMSNSGDGAKYALEVVFAKSDRAVSYILLTADVTPPTFAARVAAPVAGAAVDIASRRISFTNTVLGAGGSYTATLNGTLEYEPNAVVADQPSCG